MAKLFDKNDPPTFWSFKGHIARDTYYELSVVGRPTAKALRNLIKQIEMTAEFVADDEADIPPPHNTDASVPSEGGER